MSSHFRCNCKSHLTPTLTLINQPPKEVWILKFTVNLVICKCQNYVLYKYQPSSGHSSSLLVKTSCLRLKLVELKFFASFTTDDQSIFNVSNALVQLTDILIACPIIKLLNLTTVHDHLWFFYLFF